MKKRTDASVQSNFTVRLQANKPTQDFGKVRLGDGAITFLAQPGSGQQAAPKKAGHDAATADAGKVRLGDGAITF